MLDTVRAVRFVKEMPSGRNVPLAIEVERQSGELLEVVAKLSTSECGPGGLVREAMASMLAADLGLPVAEPFVVVTDDDFLSTLVSPQLKGRFNSQVPAFGCRLVNGMRPYLPGLAFGPSLMNSAGRTFAFDAGILNQDRLATKHNCLTDGASLLLIDHELSLNVHGRGGILAPDPWQSSALVPMTIGPTEHLFYKRIKSQNTDYPDMLDQLGKISNARIDAYANSIPPAWDRDDVLAGIVQYMKDLMVNASALSAQVEGVVA